MKNLLLTLHILAAAAWIGGGLYGSFSFRRHTANEGPRKALAVAEALGNAYFGASFAVLVLSGIGLVLVSDVYGFGSAFVLIGIAVIVAVGALEGAILGPTTRRLVETDDPTAVGSSPVLRWGHCWASRFRFAVWAMVAKPGA